MAIDPHYIPAFSIEDVILDKDTGAPLSGGLVYFEEDNQRGTLKPVYQITGTSPNYSYIQLPNPMVLSAIGTFEDSLSNPVIPYFFPYDGEFNVDLYYVRVTSSGDVPQFAREAVPYLPTQGMDEVLSVITNELSNPQFAAVVFDTSSGSYTYHVNAVTNAVINIAPDWDIIVSAPATGTITLTQLAPSGSLNVPTNPGTILTISSAGLSKLQLRQRIIGSPNLWGSGYLSATFVAKTYSGTTVTLNMFYTQSNGTVIDQPLVSALLPASGAYQSFPGSALIPISNSTQNFPNAYVDIYFDIPLSIQIDITSVMVAFTGATSINDIGYDQESYARQIDHLYHDAYPIIPIGTVIDFSGFITPAHYLFCDGTAYDRIVYQQLFRALTTTETVNLTNTMTTFDVVDGTIYAQGNPIEGNGIAPGTTIFSIATNTITMSAAATATVASAVTFFAAGNGDGSTTFNVPDLRGWVTAGSGVPNGFPFFASYGVGAKDGESNHTLLRDQLPDPLTTTAATGNFTAGAVAALIPSAGHASGTVSNNGGGTPFNVIQPSVLMRKCIRYQ